MIMFFDKLLLDLQCSFMLVVPSSFLLFNKTNLYFSIEQTKKKLARILEEKEALASQCQIPIADSMISSWEESLRNSALSIWVFDFPFIIHKLHGPFLCCQYHSLS